MKSYLTLSLFLLFNSLEARAIYSQTIQDTARSNYFLKSGLRKCEGKHYLEAIKDFESAITFDSDNWKALKYTGDAYCDLRMYELAIESYSKCLHLNDKNASAYKGRADAKQFQQ